MKKNGCVRHEPAQLFGRVINKPIYIRRIIPARDDVEGTFGFVDWRTRWRFLRHSSFGFLIRECLEQVPELGLFCLEIFFVVRISIGPDRHLLDHFQTVALEADDLLRIVRQEPELPHTEIEQNLRA